MRTSEEIEAQLAHAGVVKSGSHIVYAAGDHGDGYVAKEMLYLDPRFAHTLMRELAEHVYPGSDVLIGAAEAGIGFALELAIVVGEQYGHTPHAGWASKNGDGFMLRDVFARAVSGREVTVVEDVVNSGKSCAAVIEAINRAGGHVREVVAIWNRGTETRIGNLVPIKALVHKPLTKYRREACPMCAARMPMNTQFGHGKKWLEAHPGYPRE